MTKERDQSFVIRSLERTTVSTVKKRKQATRFIKYSKSRLHPWTRYRTNQAKTSIDK